MRSAERLYRLLLYAYPAEFRDEYGGEMLRLFRDRSRAERAVPLWLHLFADVGTTAPREHFAMLAQDVRYCLRTFAHAPGFVAAAVLSLALGIGANTAVFGVADTVLMKLLPVKEPRQLYGFVSRFADGRTSQNLSYTKFQEFEARNTAFSGLFATSARPISLGAGDTTERGAVEFVTGDYFRVLGVEAAAGRLLSPDDDRTPGGHPVAVLSYSYWKGRLGADPSAIGSTVRIDNLPFTVIGVSAEGFRGLMPGADPEIRIPMTMEPAVNREHPLLKVRRSRWLQIFGRLKPGVTARQAEAETDVLYRQMIAVDYSGELPGLPPDLVKAARAQRLVLVPGSKGLAYLRGRLERPLLVLMAIAGFVLLIACANLANLLLARAAGKRKEIAVRLALGASRPRLVRQMLTESLLLALAGGAVGMVLSVWARGLLTGFLADAGYVKELAVQTDIRALLFAAALTVLTGVLLGLGPALKATRQELAAGLREDARGASSSRWRAQKALVAGQVALSLVLLAGAALFARTLGNLRATETGVARERIVLLTLNPAANGYKPERAQAFFEELLAKARAIPGVRAAGLASTPLLSGNWAQITVVVEGHDPKPGENIDPFFNAVSPGYFDGTGMRLLAGRDFAERDRAGGPKVAVVNESFARLYLAGANPLGKRFNISGPKEPLDIEIVGVVNDAKQRSLRDAAGPEFYLPYLQQPSAEMTLHARTASDPGRVLPVLEHEVRALDRRLPVYNVRTLERQLDNLLAQERLLSLLSGFFAGLALLLAAIGLYGVVSYAAAQRTHEMGVRMALGATGGGVLRLVLKDTVLLLAAGMAIGIPAACWLLRSTEALLFGVKPLDPATIAGAAAVLCAVALIAGYIPARRATQVDPVTALRCE